MGKAGAQAAESMQSGMDKTTAAVVKNTSETEKQKQVIRDIGTEYEQVSVSVSDSTSKIERAVTVDQKELNSISVPNVSADVSRTVNVQTPDLSETLQEQDKLKESLNDIKSDAGLVAGATSMIKG